jgi:hypothetical protein
MCSFSQLKAQYYWQITSIDSITNGGTYTVNEFPEEIQLHISLCPGGLKKPNFSTGYKLTWYVNTTDSNSGGTVVNTSNKNTPQNYTDTVAFAPPTIKPGIYYYYALITDPSMAYCGFQDTLISQTVEVVVNDVLSMDPYTTSTAIMSLHPNPAKDYITVTNLSAPTSYSLYNYLGTEVRSGKTSSKDQIDITNLMNGLYFLKLENGKVLEFIKD